MSNAFAALFFVWIGILFRPGEVMQTPGLLAAALLVILVAKPLVTLSVLLGFRYPPRTAVAVGIATAQIGEFSFLLAATGMSLAIFDNTATNTLVAAGIISIILNPLLYRLIDPIARIVRQVIGTTWGARPGVATGPTGDSGEGHGRYRAVVVGYGPVGKTLVGLLRENKLNPAVIELNLQTVRELADEGIWAVYGDAASREALVQAGVERAVALILSSADARGSMETIRLARELNPQVKIIARTTYVHEIAELRRARTDAVFSSEAEVALAMAEFLLVHLGATAEQIDRQRDRIRTTILEGAPSTSLRCRTISTETILGVDSPRVEQSPRPQPFRAESLTKISRFPRPSLPASIP